MSLTLWGGVTLRCRLLVIVPLVLLVVLAFAPPCLNCCYFFFLKSCLLFVRPVRLVIMVSLSVGWNAKDTLLKKFFYGIFILFGDFFSVLCNCSWKENCFMLDYFETKLQKPGGPVCQGNLAVYYLLYAALTWKRVWHPWALDGGIRCH